MSGFGGSSSFGAAPPFGGSNSNPTFGGGSNNAAPGWGASMSQQPSSGTMMFGSSPNIAAPTTSSFGHNLSNAPPNNLPFAAPFSAVGSNSNSYTPATTSSVPFGAPPPQQMPTPFVTPFAATAPSSTPFGVSQQLQQPFSTQSTSPFAQFSNTAAPSSSSAVAFGVSANVMSSSPIPGAGAPSQSLPWNTASSNSIQVEPQRQNFPFGGAPSTFSTGSTTPFHMSSSSATQDGMEDEDGSSPMDEPPSLADPNKVQRDLAALQAKIAEKKKKIEEKRQRELEEKRKEASSLRADAAPFQPITTAAEVAQRNAVRFAESTDPSTKSQLPADLLESSADLAAQSALRNTGGSGGRAHLEQAVSLVGTCRHMCPDEELLRREREGDIQLLERPDPLVHPVAWTLRDTMVKRFRRSAADYKLDVPEWIRPPDVLERVCSYLEEWVMERDRQGPDPRYKSLPSPPPLDVYQFVWDRTRMVRKDFILQNFVGTGGLVDARAVRCHERIARWHCLCEHQLSHINDFCVMQSQQNVQELGQTMKTLNQFYDDAMGRALMEVPDESGQETSVDFADAGGTTAEIVQGTNPVDYDGQPLANAAPTTSHRLIGNHIAQNPHHGTAEPEMRGLYILLTIDNDGGLEVNKYASRLFEERPEVYHTEPVQLALSVYKAKYDRNYAKFFSILRSPSTPYLFACLMFKHVAHMRKFAMYLIHKTYGGKSKDGTSMQDSYPLKRLTSLLCFEDDEETRAACAHYNITVEDENGEETIFWKRTSFREPKDPEKGIAIPLRPRKMLKTIESKLRGATRLAVCRGDTSGAGSSLSPDQVQLILSRKGTSDRVPDKRAVALLRDQQSSVLLQARRQQMEDARKKQEEMNKLKERERLLAKEKEREERNRRLMMEQKQRETEAAIHKEKMEQERQANQLKLEREAQQRKLEELQSRQEAELRRKMEEERQAVLRREQEIRIREAAEHERRQEEERKKQLAAAERRRQQLEREAEIKRANEERRKQELFRAQEEDRQRREAEAMRVLLEKKKRLIASWKIGLWIVRILKTQQIRDASRINDSLSMLNSRSAIVSRRMLDSSIAGATATICSQQQMWCKQLEDCFANVILRMNRRTDSEFEKLDSLLLENVLCKLESKSTSAKGTGNRTIALFKIAVIFPQPRSGIERRICTTILSWMKSRLTFFEVLTGCGLHSEVRILVEDNLSMRPHTVTSDAVILVVPPPWSDSTLDQFHDVEKLLEVVDDDVPRMLFIFHDSDVSKAGETSRNLCHTLAGQYDKIYYVENTSLSPQSLEKTMRECCHYVSEMLSAEAPRTVERWSFIRIFSNSVLSLLWNPVIRNREDISLLATAVMRSVIGDITTVYGNLEHIEYSWPPTEFYTAHSSIPSVPAYFGPNMDLPVNWVSYSNGPSVEFELLRYVEMLKGPFSEVVESFVSDAPYDVRSNCQRMLDSGLVKRSLQTALLWRLQQDESDPDCPCLFLPEGVVSSAIDRALSPILQRSAHNAVYTISSQTFSDEEPTGTLSSRQGDLFSAGLSEDADTNILNDFTEQIDRPPQRTPKSQKDGSTKRSLCDAITPNGIQKPGSVQSVSLRNSESFSSRKKRQRTSVLKEGKAISMNLSESSSFTAKLEKLLHGSEVVDFIIGNGASLLSEALENAPPLVTEFDLDQPYMRALNASVPNYK